MPKIIASFIKENKNKEEIGDEFGFFTNAIFLGHTHTKTT